jgi:hypothetical protein
LAEGLPITLFLTLFRVETLTVWTVIVWSEADWDEGDYQRTTRTSTPPTTNTESFLDGVAWRPQRYNVAYKPSL